MDDYLLAAGKIEDKIVSQAKNLATKLNQEIEKGHDTKAFIIALSLAALKDFLDIILTFTVVGLVPGVDFVLGLFLTSFVFFFLLGKGWLLKWRVKFWYWVLGLFIDGLPVFAAAPTNVLLVLYAWHLTRKRAAKAQIKLRDLSTLTQTEIELLNNDISVLEEGANKEAFYSSVNFLTGIIPPTPTHAENQSLQSKNSVNSSNKSNKGLKRAA